jgi:predicted RNA binding protein YcfA (HicA-like mRNA interferase family)
MRFPAAAHDPGQPHQGLAVHNLQVVLYKRAGAMPSSREIIARLERAGFREVRQRGSHKVFRNGLTKRTVVVKHPTRDYAAGTLRSMERQSGVKLT